MSLRVELVLGILLILYSGCPSMGITPLKSFKYVHKLALITAQIVHPWELEHEKRIKKPRLNSFRDTDQAATDLKDGSSSKAL